MFPETDLTFDFQIRPFPREAVYPTGWAGERTFAQIMDDCTLLASSLIRRYTRINPHELPDALQRGFMVLWERLSKDRRLLADADRIDAVGIVRANMGKNYHERHQRHLSLDALEDQGLDAADEWMVTGMEASRSEVWAAWATATDLRIDIERIMAHLAENYLRMREPHGFRHLVALYYLTTQVELRDAALIAGVNHHHLLDNYVSVVRKDVVREFGEMYQPGTRWIEKYKRGHQEPALLVLEKYGSNPKMVAAIRCLLEEKAPSQTQEVKGYHRMRARRALEAAYHCAS